MRGPVKEEAQYWCTPGFNLILKRKNLQNRFIRNENGFCFVVIVILYAKHYHKAYSLL